jgi:hypothetical protein
MKDVYEYIRQEEINYKTMRVPVTDGYEWSMPEHIRKCTLYRDSKFTSGADDGSRPFKNIVRRIVNLQHYATGFDVKDIEPFVDNPDDYFKSLMVRKYFEKWARANGLDTYIDQKTESYVDFGGALTRHVNQVAPEVVPLQSIAFCDQSDILSGPICIKHQFSPSELRDFAENGWKNIDRVIQLARDSKTETSLSGITERVVKTPGKYVEVYELDGMFPRSWLMDKADATEDDEKTYTQQLHIITFYEDSEGNEAGIPLFQGNGDPKKYKFIARDPIFGRALGMSAIEELFDAQIWTNYAMIRLQGMLDTAAKWIGQTADQSFKTRNKLTELENGEILTHNGSPVEPINTRPLSADLFEKALDMWDEHAQNIGSAGDAILGERPSSGTPFALQQLNAQQQNNVHEYRRGKLAVSLAEEFRDWYLQDFARALSNEQTFMADLSLEELQYVAEQCAQYETKEMVKRRVIAGNSANLNPQAIGSYQDGVKGAVLKKGNKQFFKALKGDLKRLPIDVEINVAGKQKDLAGMTDKLVNVFRTIVANPTVLQIPAMAKLFNQILEYSGLDQIDFSQAQPQGQNGSSTKITEAINFKDLPPDGQTQLAAQAGIKIQSQPSPLSPPAGAPVAAAPAV